MKKEWSPGEEERIRAIAHVTENEDTLMLLEKLDSLRDQIYQLRKAALKLPRPWMDGSIEFDEWVAAVDKVCGGAS